MKSPAEDFKKRFMEIVTVFFSLQNHYLSDDSSVLGKITQFKSYLLDFDKKYPNLKLLLEEEDLTTDDLKILLIGFNSEEEILAYLKLQELPFMIKFNDKHNCLQALINYDDVKEKNTPVMLSLTALALRGFNDIKLRSMPDELKFLSKFNEESQSGSGNKMRG